MAKSNTTIGFFPSELDSPEEKASAEWGMRYAKAIESASERLEGSADNRKDRWEENRKYSEGLNDINKLKKRAVATEVEWATLSYDVATPAPKFIRTTQETIYSHPYKPRVDVPDSHSHSRMEQKKNELLAKMQLKKVVNNLKGQGVLPEQLDFKGLGDAPKDADEIEMYQKTNAKTIEQIAIEKLVKRTIAKNDMPHIERKVIEDLVRIKWAAVYTEMDENQQFKIEYLDPMLCETSYVEKEDFSDMTWGCHIGYITVGAFRESMPELTDDQILDVVRANVGRRLFDESNIELGSRNYFNLTPTEREGVEGTLIEVLNFETLQSDRVTYVEKELSTGGYDIKKRSSDYEGPKEKNPKKKVHRGIVERIYKGTFVRKTKYMMDWGLKPSVSYKVRKGKTLNKPCFGYVFRAPGILNMQNKSIVEEMIPHIDKMLILEIKALHFLSLATPPGFAYDISTIVEAIKGMGVANMKPKDFAEIKAWTGDVYFASRDEMGNPILQPGMEPIRAMPSNMDDAIERFAMLWNVELNKIKEIIGINDAVDGSTPDKKALVGVQEQAIAAHKASIRYLQTAYLEVMREVCERAAYYQQVAIKDGTITDELKDLLSEPEFAILKSKDLGELMFNVQIELLPDAQEKQQLMGRIEVALQQGALGVEDLLVIQRMMGDSIEKAEEIFQMRVERRRKQAEQSTQQQQQFEAQMGQQKEQAIAQRSQMELEMKMQLEQMIKQLEGDNLGIKGEQERMNITLEFDRKMELVEKSAQVDAQYGFDRKTETTAPKAAGRVEPSSPSPDRMTTLKN